MERKGSDLDSGMHHGRFENRCVDKAAVGSRPTISSGVRLERASGPRACSFWEFAPAILSTTFP